ncbi:hypothetical protein [Streptomyces sp. KR55]|uniref:hypothetical protein n=1 Tax=Streptomyces sp. KR55 TaxID=3457425 RepID=UPI003FD65F8D
MDGRLSSRARAIIAVVRAALLVPLGATAPAGAATPEPKNSDADVRAVKLGKPEKVEAFKSETTPRSWIRATVASGGRGSNCA